jgi:hypothetical protein
VLELVKRSGGATLKHLMKATGWQPHSVRGFLSGTLGKENGPEDRVHQNQRRARLQAREVESARTKLSPAAMAVWPTGSIEPNTQALEFFHQPGRQQRFPRRGSDSACSRHIAVDRPFQESRYCGTRCLL